MISVVYYQRDELKCNSSSLLSNDFLCNRLHLKKFIQNFANSLFLYVSLVLLCCFANFASADAPKRDFPFVPSPPQSTTHWIAKYIEQNTIPMQIKGFDTALKPANVYKFYDNWFKDKYLYTRKTVNDGELFGAKLGLYQVTVKVKTEQNGASGTLTASALHEDISTLKERVASICKGFPAPTGSTCLSDVVSYDPGTKNRVIVFINQQSVETNALYVREQMIKLGWTLNQDQTINGGTSSMLTLRKATSEMMIAINKGAQETSIVSSQTDID